MDFMILDILCVDKLPETVETDIYDKAFVDEISNENVASKSYVILFGRKQDGKSVAICVVDYQPWIRFELPDSFQEYQIKQWISNSFCANPSYKIHKLRRFYGYDGDTKNNNVPKMFQYLDIRMPSFASASIFQKQMTNLQVCDAQQQWTSKFCNDLQITASGWVHVEDLQNDCRPGKWSSCNEEYFVSWKNIRPIEKSEIAPIKILSFDGEMYSNDGLFPNVSKGDYTSVICASVYTYGSEQPFKKFECAVVNDSASKHFEHSVETSAELIEAFRNFVIEEDPDILTGWNIYGFDFGFLYEDYMTQYKHGKAPELFGLYTSRLLTKKATFVERNMASAAKGDNRFRYLEMCGRITVDLMQIIKDDKKPEDNSLKYISGLYLDPEFAKMDLTAHQMFEAWRTTDVETMKHTIRYCTRDAEIPLRLIQKLVYVPTWIEMSRVCYTPLSHVLNGGQQRRVFNVISRFVHDKYALNIRDSGWPVRDEEDSDKPDYQGATVIEPKSGFYQDPVSVLDFESLYPSIMIYFNLCPSVLVLDNSLQIEKDTHTITHFDENGNPFEKQYCFAKHIQGVLPQLLRHLLKSRKAVKALMNQTTDKFEKFVLNGRQNALKVVCNSVYGFTGVSAAKGLLPCKPVAAVTTLKGRSFIEAAKDYVESKWNANVLYGDTDSIMVLWKFGTLHPEKAVTIEEAFQLGEQASKEITEFLQQKVGGTFGVGGTLESRTAVRLANEKVECPYLLIRKKMYAAVKWTPSKNGSLSSELEYKGIDAVRRDRTKVVRELSESVLNNLMLKNNIDASLKVLKDGLASILNNNLPIEDYILSKSLKGTYASENLPHVAAWKRMQARGDPGIPPQGSRMPMVFVMPRDPKNVNLYDIAEHPEFVKRQKLRPWAFYYINNIRNVMERLFEPTNIPVSALFDDAEQRANHMASNTKSLLKRDESIQLEAATKKKRKVDEVKSKTLF